MANPLAVLAGVAAFWVVVKVLLVGGGLGFLSFFTSPLLLWAIGVWALIWVLKK